MQRILVSTWKFSNEKIYKSLFFPCDKRNKFQKQWCFISYHLLFLHLIEIINSSRVIYDNKMQNVKQQKWGNFFN